MFLVFKPTSRVSCSLQTGRISGPSGSLFLSPDKSFVVFGKADGEEGWLRLGQFLELTDGEWRALYPALAPAILYEQMEEQVQAARTRVGNFMLTHYHHEPVGPEQVRALVEAVNQASEAIHQGRQAHQDVQWLVQQLGDRMYPLQAFEAALQAHGVVLAVPGGPMQALLQVAHPLLFADAGNGAPEQETY